MRIYIDGNNSYNYGNAMLSANFIYYLSKKGKYEFFCDTKNSEDTSRLKKISNSELVRFNGTYHITNKHLLVRAFIFGLSPLKISIQIKENFDAMVFLTGDSLSEYYRILGLLFLLFKISIISRRIPTFLVGQTIGPFTSWRKKFAKFCLKKCYIYTRDRWTYDYLKNKLGLKYVYESSDLAFLDLPMQKESKEKSRILNEFDLKENQYITIIPSGLYLQYTKNIDNYVEVWMDIINQLVNHKHTKGKKIVLLAHVLDVDRNMINKINSKFNLESNSKIILATREMLPHEARIILGNSLFTITGRMHGAISTFQMKKPAISLSYSVKYQGIIGDKLKLPNLVIEASNDQIWKSKEIIDILMGKIDYLIKNYDNIISIIDRNVEISKNEVLSTINDIAKKLEGNSERKKTSN